MKAKYPKWFSIYREPYLRPEPVPPAPEITVEETVETFGEYDSPSKELLMSKDFDYLVIGGVEEYTGFDVCLRLVKKVTRQKKAATLKREQKAFEKNHANWLKEKAEHENHLKEWHRIKAEIEAEDKLKAEKAERAQLKKLKAKYEGK